MFELGQNVSGRKMTNIKELWDILLSHHYDTLIDKSFISWWFRFVKFQILARFLFLSPFEGRAGPPGSSSCLTNLFWKIFKAPRWSPSTRPMIRSPRRPLLQIQWRVFLNEQNTEARRPVLLVEMIPKVESEVSLSGDMRPKVFPIGRLSWFPTEGGKRKFCLEESLFFLSKALWGGWQEV